MDYNSAYKLNTVMLFAQNPERGFSDGGESVGKNVVKCFSGGKPFLELCCNTS